MRLRDLTEADVEWVVAMLAEPEVHRWWRYNDEADVRKDMLDPDDASTGTWVVELDDSTAAGILQWWEEPEPEYRHAGLDVALRAGHRGHGVGRAAIALGARAMFDRGHHRVTIDPAATNERAIRCYAAVGFKPVGIMRRYERGLDGTWNDGLLMDLLAEELVDP